MLIGFRCWEYKSLLHKMCFNLSPAPPISMLKLLGPGCTLVRENKSLSLRWPVSRRSQHWNLGVRGGLPEPIHFSWTGFYIPNTGIERCIDEQIKTRLQIPQVFSYRSVVVARVQLQHCNLRERVRRWGQRQIQNNKTCFLIIHPVHRPPQGDYSLTRHSV